MLYDSFYEVLNLFVASALLGIALFLFKLLISVVFFTAEELILTPCIILKVKKLSDLKSIMRSKSLFREYTAKRIVSDILIVIFFALSLSLVLYICRDGRFSLYPPLIALLCYKSVYVILSRRNNMTKAELQFIVDIVNKEHDFCFECIRQGRMICVMMN